MQPNSTIPVRTQIRDIKKSFPKDSEVGNIYADIIDTFPVSKLDKLIKKHGATEGFKGNLKYLDCPFWIWHKLQKAVSLGLHKSEPLRIFDIGMGGGHFSYVCEKLGHEVKGIDIDIPEYGDVCALLGVHRKINRIEKTNSLPKDLGKFDFITAFASQFDYIKAGEYWSVDEWCLFIEDLSETMLNRPGKLHFNPNEAINLETGECYKKPWLHDVASRFNGRFNDKTSVLEIDFE